jgi:hypothetical protein
MSDRHCSTDALKRTTVQCNLTEETFFHGRMRLCNILLELGVKFDWVPVGVVS